MKTIKKSCGVLIMLCVLVVIGVTFGQSSA